MKTEFVRADLKLLNTGRGKKGGGDCKKLMKKSTGDPCSATPIASSSRHELQMWCPTSTFSQKYGSA